MAAIERRAYAEIFGPTVGDRVRLADTDLIVEVEADYTLRAGSYGEEVKFGGGKTIRDGMAQSQRTRAQGAVDTVLTNALIMDHWGIVKADIGLKGGRIVAIGKAGNPDTQPGVDIIIGPGTEIIAGIDELGVLLMGQPGGVYWYEFPAGPAFFGRQNVLDVQIDNGMSDVENNVQVCLTGRLLDYPRGEAGAGRVGEHGARREVRGRDVLPAPESGDVTVSFPQGRVA